MKDKYAERRCIGCDGKGYSEDSESVSEHNKVTIKTITRRGKCYRCKGIGTEKFIISHALFKNPRKDLFYGYCINIKGKTTSIRASGWYEIYKWLKYKVVWQYGLHKPLEKIGLKYNHLKSDYEGNVHFDILAFNKFGGDYMMPNNYHVSFGFLGFQLAFDWIDEGKWKPCKDCGNMIPIIKDFGDLCVECRYPEKKLVIDIPDNKIYEEVKI